MEDCKSSKYYYTICEFMWRDLKLKPAAALILSIIIAYGGYQCDIDGLIDVIGMSEKTIRNYLKAMVESEIILCESLPIKTNVTRNIYVSRYDKNGRLRRTEETNTLMQEGVRKCLEYYDKRGKYRKGCKKDKKYTS